MNETNGVSPEEVTSVEYAELPHFTAGHTHTCEACANMIADMHTFMGEVSAMTKELKPLVNSFSGQDMSKLASPMGLLSLFTAKPKR